MCGLAGYASDDRPELRAELEAKGHRFRGTRDTEVLVHPYDELGEGLLDHLDGMFAFGLWDGLRRRLLLARDSSGIASMGSRPLYIGGSAMLTASDWDDDGARLPRPQWPAYQRVG